ncbi:lysophospholipase [Martiniozyma asiatica (nom. inval.)]|nr:lysophospholipase [Martiniozyma asiatica]
MIQLSSLALLIGYAIAWSPSNNYAPAIVDCPSDIDSKKYGFLREANDISQQESDWMDKRDNVTFDSLRTFLKDTEFTNFDSESFMDSIANNASAQIPRIGLAFSGGGYRALLCAAGEIAGLDNRTIGTAEHGLPLLDATSYIAGLSGGSWFLSSLVYNNWTSVQDIIDQNGQDDAIWDFNHNIITPHGYNIISNGGYWKDLDDWVDEKRDAGFEVALTDPWGRGLSRQFFPTSPEYGAPMGFTDVQNYPVFENHLMPFPIVVADGRQPGTKIISGNSTIFEFNPYEMGSWDPYLNSFVDLEYVGTPMDAGNVTGNGSCWTGLAQTGFVFGTSSTLFNQFLLQLNSTSLSPTVYSIANDLLTDLSNDENDISPWYPNPFYKTPFGSSKSISDNDTLFLVDGGEDYQNVPLWPLIQPSRELDVIFAFDNSADTDYSWPNLTSLSWTYERQFLESSNDVAVPYIPGVDTMLHYNLTSRPTFFGCYASNLTSLMEKQNVSTVPPLIIAIANREWSYHSNTSTFKLSYSDDEKLSMIQNGFEVSTFNNLTVDADFRKCVGCAILQRSKERMGVEIGDECKQCFDTYCWDGSTYINDNGIYPNGAFTDWGQYNSTESGLSAEDIDASTVSATGSVSTIKSASSSNDGSSILSTHGSILGFIVMLLGFFI